MAMMILDDACEPPTDIAVRVVGPC